DYNLTLQTEFIALRPLEATDFDEFKAISNFPMWKYFTQDLGNNNELEVWVNEALKAQEQNTRIPFTILERSTGKVLGSTSFGNISPRDKRLEIGWTWIGKPFHGTGVNEQIKYLMLKYSFEKLDFERVEAKTDVLNIPARNALKKIGMIEEGVLRSHTLMTFGRRRDTIFYSLLKSEWNDIEKYNGWP
ncbi:MAG TPA: GNAT family protein, partial [Anditalea sp.]|nr:GNAT family protein [Anditalea sp.]